MIPSCRRRAFPIIAAGLMLLARQGVIAAQTEELGRINGRVVDAGTGRPLSGVSVGAGTAASTTDIDGRFRLGPMKAGVYKVRAVMLGYAPAGYDSIKVAGGQTTALNISLKASTVQIEDLVVVSEQQPRAATAAGLLAEQKNAPAVSDGISSETMARSPDNDAAGAITRVTGLSVVADKVIVRGLGERYSNTVVNGSEVSSPDPDSKFIPLDVFPTDLLEAIVATKTGTPDQPGDFTGGSVNVRTKQFPDNRVLKFKVTAAGNSNATFESFPDAPRTSYSTPVPDATLSKRWVQAFNPQWTPPSSEAGPNFSVEASFGDQHTLGPNGLGYVFSANYGQARTYNPSFISALGSGFYDYRMAATLQAAGGIANIAFRLGDNTKFTWNNLLTWSTEDNAVQGAGAPSDLPGSTVKQFQMNFIERYVWQSQLGGETRFGGTGCGFICVPVSLLTWAVSYGQARFQDEDNRQLTYLALPGAPEYVISARIPNYRTDALLNDEVFTAKADFSVPFRIRSPEDALIKVGGIYQNRSRNFSGQSYGIGVIGPEDVYALPPEQFLAPENDVSYDPSLSTLFPYTGYDRIGSMYAMFDGLVLPKLRVVGGLRVENWSVEVDITQGVRPDSGAPPNQGITQLEKLDPLWSLNLSYALTDRINIRLAGFKSVTRPDLRELAPGGYVPLVGGYLVIGNPNLIPGTALNFDARFEYYPAAGDVIALGFFRKNFTNPIVSTIILAGEPVVMPENATSALSTGLEVEARTGLGFASRALRGFGIGGNLTLISSSVELPPELGIYPENLRFQGQSPTLFNVSLSYVSPRPRLAATVLLNGFSDRITRYGIQVGTYQSPNIIERSRYTLDAKLQLGLWGGATLSFYGRNLTNPTVLTTEDRILEGSTTENISTKTKLGVDYGMSIEYAF